MSETLETKAYERAFFLIENGYASPDETVESLKDKIMKNLSSLEEDKSVVNNIESVNIDKSLVDDFTKEEE